jgi:hypothetical protein
MPHKTFTGRHGFLFNGNKPKQEYEKPKIKPTVSSIKSVKPVNIIYK